MSILSISLENRGLYSVCNSHFILLVLGRLTENISNISKVIIWNFTVYSTRLTNFREKGLICVLRDTNFCDLGY